MMGVVRHLKGWRYHLKGRRFSVALDTGVRARKETPSSVINRGNGRRGVFHQDGDYHASLKAMGHACLAIPTPILGVPPDAQTDWRADWLALIRGSTLAGGVMRSESTEGRKCRGL
jgi:hypothetical protein